jgi:hypothetical protein
MKQLEYLNDQERALIAENLKLSTNIYRAMLVEIKNAASAKAERKAA